MHDITGCDHNICVRSDKLLPWDTIQKFLLICIVTIDDRLYNELAENIGNLFWTPDDTQTQHPQTIWSTAWSCVSFLSTTIGSEVSFVNGRSIECTHNDSNDAATAPTTSRITSTKSACSRFGVWTNFCSLLRFATGEWKNHLTMIIDQFTFIATESDITPPFTNESKQQEITIVSSISDFLVATMSFMVQFADDDDNHDMSHSTSFGCDTTSTTIIDGSTNSTDRDTFTFDCIDECVNRVFTALTSELES